MIKSFTKFFQRKHPYTVAFYIGRKKTQKIFDCKIKKKKDLLSAK
mgnify:CR=1 FL=1